MTGDQWQEADRTRLRTARLLDCPAKHTDTRKLDSYTCENVNPVLVLWGSELDVSVMRTLMDDTA